MAWKVDVENDEIGGFLGEKRARLRPVVKKIYGMSFVPEPVGDALSEAEVVFDDDDAHAQFCDAMKASCKLRG